MFQENRPSTVAFLQRCICEQVLSRHLPREGTRALITVAGGFQADFCDVHSQSKATFSLPRLTLVYESVFAMGLI